MDKPTRLERTDMGTPFPWLPMVAISMGLVVHSYALTNLFPYVGYMVQSLGVTDDKDEAGKLKRAFGMMLQFPNTETVP